MYSTAWVRTSSIILWVALMGGLGNIHHENRSSDFRGAGYTVLNSKLASELMYGGVQHTYVGTVLERCSGVSYPMLKTSPGKKCRYLSRYITSPAHGISDNSTVCPPDAAPTTRG